jgi:tripartite-type tricarboxylate transporter receptor subunit TctC
MRIARVLVGLLVAMLWACAFGQDYPTRPIRFVVGFPPGSGVDTAARALAERLRDVLGQPVVVENKSGADGIIAARHVASAAPDGYTLLAASNGQMSIIPVLQPTRPYDPIRDFDPISLVARWPVALVVTPAVPAASVAELVSYASAHPGELNAGVASSNYMFATEMFSRLTGISMQYIPYRGVSGVVNGLLAGDIQVAIVNTISSTPYVRTGQLKALAVNGAVRLSTMPGVPTMDEAGVHGFGFDLWMGLFAPAGTPQKIVVRLHAAIAESLKSEDLRARFAALGIAATGSSPQAVHDTIDRDTKAYGGLAKAIRAADR